MRIAVVAPGGPIDADLADAVAALAATTHPGVELAFHAQCSLRHNHFAGSDEARADALVEAANDPALDAVWFARGGYGTCRIAENVIERLRSPARAKAWLGYSDAGFLLAGLYRAGFAGLAHGPMPQDLKRGGGEAAVARALDWLTRRSAEALEPGIDGVRPTAAFNIIVLSQLLGTPLEPDLSGHVLMLEEVSEHLYATDRAMFHITASPNIRSVAGIRAGRFSLVPENDPDFGADGLAIIRYWCGRAGIPFLGPADIGHDAGNKVVPFGAYVR